MPGRHQRQTDRRMQESEIYRMKEKKLKELLEQPKLRFIIVSMILRAGWWAKENFNYMHRHMYIRTHTLSLSHIKKKKILDIGTGLHQ